MKDVVTALNRTVFALFRILHEWAWLAATYAHEISVFALAQDEFAVLFRKIDVRDRTDETGHCDEARFGKAGKVGREVMRKLAA